MHSSSRPSSILFWPQALLQIDRFFPLSVCSSRWYFSYDTDDGDILPPILAKLYSPPVLIRRGIARNEGEVSSWSEAMLVDLNQVEEEYVFHVMDDLAIPDPLDADTMGSLVRAAAELGAANVGLWSFNFIPKLGRPELVAPPPGRFLAVDHLRDDLALELRTGCPRIGGRAKVS